MSFFTLMFPLNKSNNRQIIKFLYIYSFFFLYYFIINLAIVVGALVGCYILHH